MNHADYSAHRQVNETGYARTLHAEEVALDKVRSKRRKNAFLIVIRLSCAINPTLRDSKPCEFCIHRIMSSRKVNIRRVYYSDSNGNIVFDKPEKLMGHVSTFYKKHIS